MRSEHRGTSLPLPALLHLDGPVPMVGRDAPSEALDQAWRRCTDGPRQLVLVAGDAGTGKTRLVTEFARRAHQAGATVLYGTCSEEQTLPYQPFAEALDHVVASIDPSATGLDLGPAVGELARLVPRLATGPVATPADGTDAAERARLFGAVGDVLGRLGAAASLVLVLEDVHWARRPTIDLLARLARDPALERSLIVCTYRSAPAETGDALRSALPDLRRLPGVTWLPIGGLDRAGVEDFVEAAAGHTVGDDLRAAVDVLERQTDGNAFLLVELWQHLVDTGHLDRAEGRWTVRTPLADSSTPEGVREVVAARLERLDPAVRRALQVAAVAGPRFDARVLAAATDQAAHTIVAVLDEAVRSRLVVEENEVGGYRFAHELIRRSIVDRLSGTDRRRSHLALARALDVGSPTDPFAEIATHLVAAVPLVEVDDAVAAAVRAADAATSAFAYDDAARFLDDAATLATTGRADLLLRVADAAMRAGDVERAEQRCLAADELARRSNDDRVRIAAALAYGEAAWRGAAASPTAVDLLRTVLPLAADRSTRVTVQAALARSLALAGETDAAWVLLEDALSASEALESTVPSRVTFDALSFVTWTPETVGRQLAAMRSAVESERDSGDLEWECYALSKTAYGSILVGDLDGARNLARRHHDLSARINQPLFGILDHQFHCLLATAEGRFTEAEALAEAADDLARSTSSVAAGAYGVQLFSLRREQGRLEEARPLVEAVVRLDRAGSTWRPALALLYAELGMRDAAVGELEELTIDRVASVSRDGLWFGSLAYLADACASVGHRPSAPTLYDELVGWRGLVVQVGHFLAAHGAVDRQLGRLAALLGHEREAEIHFDAALRIDAAARMPVWLAHSRLDAGTFLLRRGADGDRGRGLALVTEARATAARLGMPAVAAAAAEVLSGDAGVDVSSAVDEAPSGLSVREVDVLELVASGCSNREIGRRLHISQHTAANHVRSILMKTQCANRTEAAAWALRHRIGGTA